MPNFNPFASDTEDTSFETGTPVTHAAKTAAQATNAQADAQVQAANKAIVDQLYGPSTPTGQDKGTDEANPSHVNQSNAASRAAAHAGTNTTSNSNQTPEEQAKMERIRHELFANYSGKFRSAQNGAHGLITDVEQQMEKARREREQKEQQRKQEEEEEEQKKREEKAQMDQELGGINPAGKNAGRNRMGQPIAVQMAKTKTEINRGTTG